MKKVYSICENCGNTSVIDQSEEDCFICGEAVNVVDKSTFEAFRVSPLISDKITLTKPVEEESKETEEAVA